LAVQDGAVEMELRILSALRQRLVDERLLLVQGEVRRGRGCEESHSVGNH
jgi:hypothetical protein